MLQSFNRRKENGVNVLVAIRYAFAGVGDVSSAVIAKCFWKSRFTTAGESIGDDDDVALSQLISIMWDEIPPARLRN